jgi:hypothetical protein
MTRLLATILLLLTAFQASPSRAADAAQVERTHEILGVALTPKRIAIDVAVAAGIGVAAIAAVVEESLAIGTGASFLSTLALFEFLILPVEVGVGAYFWPDTGEREGPGSPAPPAPQEGS